MRFINATFHPELTQQSAGLQPTEFWINADAVLLIKKNNDEFNLVLRPDWAQTIQHQVFGGLAKIKGITASVNPNDL